jgi:hypothetical protein
VLLELVPQIAAGVAEVIKPLISNLHNATAPQCECTSIPPSKPRAAIATTRLLEATPLEVVITASDRSTPCRLLERAPIASNDSTPCTTASTYCLPERPMTQRADSTKACDDFQVDLALHLFVPQGEMYTSSMATTPLVQRHASDGREPIRAGASTSEQ